MDERTVEVLNIIIQSGPITGPEILKLCRHSMNIKTLRANIERLNLLLAQIGDGTLQIESIRNQGYQFNHSYFSWSEYRFLKDSIEHSKLLNQAEVRHLLGLCDPLHQLSEKAPASSYHDGFLNTLAVCQKAIANERSLKFSYLEYHLMQQNKGYEVMKQYRKKGNDKSDESGETYVISPYEIMMHKGQYYVLSYCDKHPDNLTIFRIDRMAKVRLAMNTYFHQLKEIVDYDKKKAQMVNMFVGQQEIERLVIKFEQAIFPAVLDEFGFEVTLDIDIDGKPLLVLENFAISEGLIGWILMMGEKVEVLEPQSLRHQLHERLKKMILQYRTSRMM